MAYSTGLAGRSATTDGYRNIEITLKVGNLKRLPNYHSCRLTSEKYIQRSVIYSDLAFAGAQVHPRS
jgi:hypothetical protein